MAPICCEHDGFAIPASDSKWYRLVLTAVLNLCSLLLQYAGTSCQMIQPLCELLLSRSCWTGYCSRRSTWECSSCSMDTWSGNPCNGSLQQCARGELQHTPGSFRCLPHSSCMLKSLQSCYHAPTLISSKCRCCTCVDCPICDASQAQFAS